MVKKPQNRAEAVRALIEKLGGQEKEFWFSFGGYDIVGIIEMPDSVSTAAFAMAVSAGGACKGVKTKPLLTIEEGVEAMKKAATCEYTPAKKAKYRGTRILYSYGVNIPLQIHVGGVPRPSSFLARAAAFLWPLTRSPTPGTDRRR